MIIPWEHPGQLLPRLAAPFGPFDSMLDVGGGPGHIGMGQWGTDNIHILDIWEPKTRPANFTLGNALDCERIYGRKSFDLVVAAEVIEHLPKESKSAFFTALESVARKLVMITTPNGFKPQEPGEHEGEVWNNNPYQKHLCGYDPQDFTEAGYEVIFNSGDGQAHGSQLIAWKDVR